MMRSGHFQIFCLHLGITTEAVSCFNVIAKFLGGLANSALSWTWAILRSYPAFAAN
jgi:hypothetical protein